MKHPGTGPRALVILFVALAAVAIGCSSKAPTPTPTASSTPSATPSSTPSPSATTAIPVVTPGPMPAVIAQAASAVLQRQPAALAAMATYQQVACTRAQGAGGPPKCKGNDPEGTKYRVFPAGRCEMEWVEDATDAITRFTTTVGTIYAAVSVRAPSPDPEPYVPRGQYVLIFSGNGSNPGGYLMLSGTNQVLRASLTCETGPGADDLVVRRVFAAEYVIPPRISGMP